MGSKICISSPSTFCAVTNKHSWKSGKGGLSITPPMLIPMMVSSMCLFSPPFALFPFSFLLFQCKINQLLVSACLWFPFFTHVPVHNAPTCPIQCFNCPHICVETTVTDKAGVLGTSQARPVVFCLLPVFFVKNKENELNEWEDICIDKPQKLVPSMLNNFRG